MPAIPAVIAFITWALENVPTLISDGAKVAQFVMGARAAVTELVSANPNAVTPEGKAALEAALAALESTWAAELAAAKAAQAPTA